MTTSSTALTLSRTHLEDLCEKWVQKNLEVLSVNGAEEALTLLTERFQEPGRTATGILHISFSVFALRTFAMIVRELSAKQRVWVFHAPRGNGGIERARAEGQVW